MILIIIKFCELLFRISLTILNSLISYIKHLKEFTKLWLKKARLSRFFNPLVSVWISDETLFLVFDILHQNQLASHFVHSVYVSV